jgi:hypothetical protein
MHCSCILRKDPDHGSPGLISLHLLLSGVAVNVINLGRGSTAALPAAMCWYDYVPATADLVIVEYSANGCLRMQW